MWSSLDHSDGYSLRPCESKGSNCTREMAWVPSMGSAALGHNVDTRFSSRRTRLYGRRALLAATWNVQSLVESYGGDARICRSRPQKSALGKCTGVDRKLDFLVKELRRYCVSVAAVQETKWFGTDVWEAQGYTFLHSGRPLPCEEGPAVRREGVGIVLDEGATAAWREAGEKWKAVSSRIVTARLKSTSVGQRRAGGLRETRNTYITGPQFCQYFYMERKHGLLKQRA